MHLCKWDKSEERFFRFCLTLHKIYGASRQFSINLTSNGQVIGFDSLWVLSPPGFLNKGLETHFSIVLILRTILCLIGSVCDSIPFVKALIAWEAALGITEADIGALAVDALADPLTGSNPVPVSEQAYRDLYKQAIRGAIG